MPTVSERLEKLRGRAQQVYDMSQDILQRAENEDRADLTKDEFRESKQLIEEYESLKDQIELLERQQNAGTWLSTPSTKEERGGSNYQPAKKDEYRSLGEQLVSVAHAGQTGGRVDPRLVQRATGASEGVGADGGFLVQNDFASDLREKAFDTALLASRVRRTPISSNSNSLKLKLIDETSRANGSRYGGVQAFWEGEADAITGSKPKFRQVEMNLHKLTGLMYATDELLQDAPALEALAREWFSDEFGFKLDDAIVNGDGAGKPLGFLKSPCLVTQAKEGSQVVATVVYENIVNMWSRMLPKHRANSIWAINMEIEPQLYTMSLSVGTGGAPVYLPPRGAADAPFSTLFNRPVIPIEQAAALGTVGDINLIDPMAYRLIEKGGMQSAVSIHVKFVEDEVAFRFILRIDGQPTRNAALTPYKGSNTLSPFVTLATRA